MTAAAPLTALGCGVAALEYSFRIRTAPRRAIHKNIIEHLLHLIKKRAYILRGRRRVFLQAQNITGLTRFALRKRLPYSASSRQHVVQIEQRLGLAKRFVETVKPRVRIDRRHPQRLARQRVA